MNKISGVYKITNTITGDCYVGSSRNIKSRWVNHKSPSTWALCPGMKLYQAFTNYGLNNFKFEIIEETNNLIEREQYWIDQLKPSYNSKRAKLTREELLDQYKEWHRSHMEEHNAYSRDWYKSHRGERLAYYKNYNRRLCFYNGETLTLSSLYQRFRRQGISQPMQEAKKYLVQ